MTCSGPDMLETPSYASGAIMGIFITLSLVIERSIHYLGKYFEKRKQKAFSRALEAMKEELMLLGFISLFLTVFQNLFASICVPVRRVRLTFLICNQEELPGAAAVVYGAAAVVYNTTEPEHRRSLLAETVSSCPAGRTPFIGIEALHQIHIFIFTLAGVHIFYSLTVMLLAYLKIKRWSTWEREAIAEARAYHKNSNEKKPGLTHMSTFQRRHSARAEIWVVDWALCFIKSLYRAVAKADYKALRVAFITTHNLSHDFAFHKFLLRSLEDDYSYVVGVTPFMWLFVVFFVIFDIPQGHIVYWLPDIFVMIILLVGAKLARVVQVLARDIDMDSMNVCVGVQLKPRDSLFWFKRPALMRMLMHFTLFTNSFQLATLIFYAWQFGVDSCYFFNRPYAYLRAIISVALILFTSWVTLPTYSVVSQMGSHYRPTIFGDHVQHHIKGWAKRHKAQRPAEPNKLHTAIGSVLNVLNADSMFSKNKSDPGEDSTNTFTSEDVNEVMEAADLQILVRPSMVDEGEQIGDGAINGTANRNEQDGIARTNGSIKRAEP